MPTLTRALVAALMLTVSLEGAGIAATAPTRPKTTSGTAAAAKPAVDPAAMMAATMKMMDRLFPTGPEPDPARLALARDATMTMFPRGTYAQAMNGFIDRTVEHALSMSEADFADFTPGAKKVAGKAPSTEPLRVVMSRKDPSFDAKVAAVKAFVQTTIVKMGDVAEPKFREGMARALARKFDARQLGEIRGFLATPTGAAYGRAMIGLWFEPDVMRGTFEAMPELMRMMPDIAKSGQALDAQMKASGAKNGD